MAKNFTSEEVIVKLQILNLAAKLCLVNPKQTKLLAQYVFSLAKYDQNYDIRDQVWTIENSKLLIVLMNLLNPFLLSIYLILIHRLLF